MNSISRYFKKNKKIPLDKFLYEILYNKNFGYYSKKYPFEKKGDFVTSPFISSLFGEMLSIWILMFCKSFKKSKKFNIIELGPGNGGLTKIIQKTLKNFPEFYNNCNFYLYEKSEYLIKVQKKNLKQYKIKWIKNFNNLTNGPVLFFGNEFFDAIPIKQFKRTKKNILECFIKINNEGNIEKIFHKTSVSNTKKINSYKILKNSKFIEFPKLGFDFIDSIIKKIKKLDGGILLIDYGYLKQKNLDTLQSVKNHKKNELFENLGNADITSLVNFSLLKNHITNKNLKVNNIVSQSFFLKKMGILERAEIISTKMSFRDKSDLYIRIKRLLDSSLMGELFKVLLAHKSKNKNIAGFN